MRKKIMGVLVIGLLLFIPIFAKADEYIKSISLGTIDNFNLDKASKAWNLTYYDPTGEYATINVVPQDGVTIEGDGKVAITEGQNTFVIKASKGESTQNYTLNVNVVRQELNGDNPVTGDFLPVSIIIVCLGASIGYFAVKRKNKFYKI